MGRSEPAFVDSGTLFPLLKTGFPTAEAGAFKSPSDVFHVLVSLTFSGQKLNIFFPSFFFPKMLAVPFSSELAIYNVDFGQSGGRWKKNKTKQKNPHTAELGWF